VLAAIDQYGIDRRGLDIDTGATTAGPHVDDVMASPGGTLAGIWHTGTDGKITLAAHLRTSPAERFLQSEDSLRYHTLGGYHRTFGGGFAASIRFSSRFYFGLSLAAQYSHLIMRYARDTALEAGRDPARGIQSDCGGVPCGVENPAATEGYQVDVNTGLLSASNVLAANVGVVVMLHRDVWLGLAYHAPPGLAIQNVLSGTMVVEGAPRDGGGIVSGGSTVYLSQPASIDAEVRARMPQDLDLHVGFRWEDLSRMRIYDVRGYGSAFPAAGVPEWTPRTRGFHDAFAMWAGLDQVDTGSPVRFGGRIGFETSSLDDSRTTPWTIAPASLTLDGGVQYGFFMGTYRVLLQGTYGLQYFPTVHVTDSGFDPRDRLACYDSGFDYSNTACAATRAGYAIPTAMGDYSRLEHAFRLGLGVQFR